MAYTLAQLAQLEQNALRKGIMMTILRYTSIMDVIPWENVDSLKIMASRWATLPTVAFRRVNEGYSPNEGTDEQVWEALYGFGGEIKFDRVFEKVRNVVVDPKVNETQKKLKAMAMTFNDYFINGDHATDPDGFEGLKKRIANSASRQSVYFAGAAGGSTAALDPTASAANANTFLSKFEEAHYKCNAGRVSAVFMNETMYWGFGRVLRYLGSAGGSLMDMTKDQFDRTQITYKGTRFIDVGLKRDQSTEIITDTETALDSGSDATSIYFASFGDDEGLMGAQLGPMEVYDPLNGGEQESTPTKLLRIDWWLGLVSLGKYCLVRGVNCEGAANWTA
jgi:hypothetical protein